ncbi:hypothetical protein C8J57DRAFT_1247772 [Mycena rebaudengoi]|nr:hypothetical protein C8J57DRAFT_1247772 [Mycena rebaudengoi]
MQKSGWELPLLPQVGASSANALKWEHPPQNRGVQGPFHHKTLYFASCAALAFRVWMVVVGYVLPWNMDAWGRAGWLDRCWAAHSDPCTAGRLDRWLGAGWDGWIALGSTVGSLRWDN